MTTGKRLEQAREELLAFESEHPRSREDVVESAEEWLATARHVAALDIAGVIGGSGLQREHLALAIDAFTVNSAAFAEWIVEQAAVDGLLSRRDHNKQLDKLRKAITTAEAACVREEIETRRAELEKELAALGA